MSINYYIEHEGNIINQINADCYNMLLRQYEKLNKLQDYDKLFACLIDEYKEFKKYLYSITIDNSLKKILDNDFIEDQKCKMKLYRYFINTLNLIKKYQDIHHKAIRDKHGNITKHTGIVLEISDSEQLLSKSWKLSSEIYDNSIEYFILYSIRNLEQHVNEFSIDSYKKGLHNIINRENGDYAVQYFTSFIIKTSKLKTLLIKHKICSKEKIGKYNFDSLGEENDFLYLLDKYIEHVSSIHINDHKLCNEVIHAIMRNFYVEENNKRLNLIKIFKKNEIEVFDVKNFFLSRIEKFNKFFHSQYMSEIYPSALYLHPYLPIKEERMKHFCSYSHHQITPEIEAQLPDINEPLRKKKCVFCAYLLGVRYSLNDFHLNEVEGCLEYTNQNGITFKPKIVDILDKLPNSRNQKLDKCPETAFKLGLTSIKQTNNK